MDLDLDGAILQLEVAASESPGDLTVSSLHPGPDQAMSFTQRKPMVAQRSRPGYINSIFS